MTASTRTIVCGAIDLASKIVLTVIIFLFEIQILTH